jgi:SAM-dependent methyltransferase
VGSVVELAVGTAGSRARSRRPAIAVIGVDRSEGMLAVARDVRARARRRGVRRPAPRRPARAARRRSRVPLVIIPFRSLLHMETEEDAPRRWPRRTPLLEPDGRLVFDVFAPSPEDIEDTNGRWIEREPGIFERAVWDEDARTLSLSVRAASRRRR